MMFQDFIASQKKPKSTLITRLIQGYETHSFKLNFSSWPSSSTPSGAEEGRGKVAGRATIYIIFIHILLNLISNDAIFCLGKWSALLKQQGGSAKSNSKSAPVNEEIPPLLQCGGKTEV